MTRELQKYADVAMFKAAPINAESGPRVQLLSCNNDPLGTIASAAKMYKGEYVESLAQISDEERRHYLADVRKNVLAAPLEFVNFHFLISGVTRGFTHQMVRQRTATYTQESTRFAVKEDVPVGRPPSLSGTVSYEECFVRHAKELYPNLAALTTEQTEQVTDYMWNQVSQEQKWRFTWDESVQCIGNSYNNLIDSGMPAEDARGLLPTNLLTRINYNTSLRGLLEHSGLRLCTQAQFEWRLVWVKMMDAIREYGLYQYYDRPPEPLDLADRSDLPGYPHFSSLWQFEELSKIFKPICYQKGSCQFLSDVDRACTIRDRVQDFAKHGISSSQWGEDLPIWPKDGRHWSDAAQDPEHVIHGIRDEEWMLDPTAARVSQ
jgi:flavin-dependent thymidylate synthase